MNIVNVVNIVLRLKGVGMCVAQNVDLRCEGWHVPDRFSSPAFGSGKGCCHRGGATDQVQLDRLLTISYNYSMLRAPRFADFRPLRVLLLAAVAISASFHTHQLDAKLPLALDLSFELLEE